MGGRVLLIGGVMPWSERDRNAVQIGKDYTKRKRSTNKQVGTNLRPAMELARIGASSITNPSHLRSRPQLGHL